MEDDVLAERARLKESARVSPDGLATVQLALHRPISVEEGLDLIDKAELVSLTASFPGFIGGTTLTTNMKFLPARTFDETMNLWATSLLVDLTQAQKTSAATEAVVDDLNTLRQAVEEGRFPIVAVGVNLTYGKAETISQTLGESLYSVQVGEGAVPLLPIDQASIDIREQACG